MTDGFAQAANEDGNRRIFEAITAQGTGEHGSTNVLM